MIFYHVEINSIYIELVKCRYKGKHYSKWDIKYYSKASGSLLSYERGVKIRHELFKHWEKMERIGCMIRDNYQAVD
jgi:hypothetical protein